LRRKVAEALARIADADLARHLQAALSVEKDSEARDWLVIALCRATHTWSKDVGATPTHENNNHFGLFWALSVADSLSHTTDTKTIESAFHALIDDFGYARANGILGRQVLEALALFAPKLDHSTQNLAADALFYGVSDIRLRVDAANALGAFSGLVDRLLDVARNERHVDARVPEAMAIAKAGKAKPAYELLIRFAGVPEADPSVIAALCDPVFKDVRGKNVVCGNDNHIVNMTIELPPATAHRLLVASDSQGLCSAKLDAHDLPGKATDGVCIIELGSQFTSQKTVRLTASRAAILARGDDLPPPKPDRGLSSP
jgi:hypothetical protein